MAARRVARDRDPVRIAAPLGRVTVDPRERRTTLAHDVVEGRFLLGDLLARRGRPEARAVLTRALTEAERAVNALLVDDAKKALKDLSDRSPRLDPSGLDDSTDEGLPES